MPEPLIKLIATIMPVITLALGALLGILKNRSNNKIKNLVDIKSKSLLFYTEIDLNLSSKCFDRSVSITLHKIFDPIENRPYIIPDLLRTLERLDILLDTKNAMPVKNHLLCDKHISKEFRYLKSVLAYELNQTKRVLGYPYDSLFHSIRRFGILPAALFSMGAFTIALAWLYAYYSLTLTDHPLRALIVLLSPVILLAIWAIIVYFLDKYCSRRIQYWIYVYQANQKNK